MPRKEWKVFRVTQIPPQYSILELSSTLEYVFQVDQVTLDCNQSILCPSCLENDKTNIALIHFQPYPPIVLENLPDNDTFTVNFLGSEIHIDKDFYGLTQLYPTVGHIKADIVAVCGLNGHAYGSWASKADNKHQKKMWLRHFLAQDLPDCRTMIYGYNSKLTSYSIHEIPDYTNSLLEDLVQARQGKNENRPIIFIGHSFGGIIIAQSIVEAKVNETRFGALCKSIRATIFFATPHRGLVVDDILASIGEDSPRQDLIKSIEFNAKGLERELQRFINYSTRLNLKIISFKEMGQTQKLVKGPDEQWSRAGEYFTAVDYQSSILRLPDSIEETLSVEGDHSTIVKLNSKGNRTYASALRHLKNIVENNGHESPAPQLSPTLQLPPTSSPGHRYLLDEEQARTSGLTLQRPIQGKRGYEGTREHSPAPSFRTNNQPVPPSLDQARISTYFPPSRQWGVGGMVNPYTTPYEATSQRSVSDEDQTTASRAYFAQPGQLDRGLRDTVGKPYPVQYGSPSHRIQPYQGQATTPRVYFDEPRVRDRGYSSAWPLAPTYLGEPNPAHPATVQPYITSSGTQFISPAHEAVANGNDHALEQHLQNTRVSLDTLVTFAGRGNTFLHIASINGDEATVSVLLRHGAKPSIVNEAGRTALHEAATRGFDKVVELLLNSGANIRAELQENWNALHLAAQDGHQMVVLVLLRGGADIDAITRQYWTALHLAASAGHDMVVEMLLRNKADISMKLEGDWSALHLAADCGHDKVVRVLLANHADINAKKRDGWSALHLAASRGNEGVVMELLAKGVDINAKVNGKKARDIAAAGGHTSVEVLLKDAAKRR